MDTQSIRPFALISSVLLEYRNDCDSNNIRKNYQMDLLAFRNDVADGLLALSAVQSLSGKRGRPKQSEDLDLSNNPSTSKPKFSYERAPSDSIRFDGIEHWPEYTPVKRIYKVPECEDICMQNTTFISTFQMAPEIALDYNMKTEVSYRFISIFELVFFYFFLSRSYTDADLLLE